MRPVSGALLEAVHSSHRAVFRARVIPPGSYHEGTNPPGVRIPVLDGSVTFDATADVQATLDLTTDGTGWDPRPGKHPVQPYGSEIFVERGVRLGPSTEWVSLGYYRIDSVEQETAPNGTLRVAGRDRMSLIVDSRPTQPSGYEAGTETAAYVATIAREVYPGLTVNWDDPAGQVRATNVVAIEDSRYDVIRDLVTSRGAVMGFDHRGQLTIKPLPDPAEPVFDVRVAREDGVLVSTSRSIDRQGVYNGVSAYGEAADDTPPVRVVIVDTDPASPTYWHGPYGQIPRFYSSDLLKTKTQCANAARTLLLKSLGLPYYLDFQAVPNPALEVYDPVLVQYSTRVAKEIHVLDKITIPLKADAAMTAETRKQTTTGVGIADLPDQDAA